MLNSFELFTPKTLDEAVKIYSENAECRVLAGGTDLFVEMHAGNEYPCLMDIKQINELKGLNFIEENGLSIGALVTYGELERSEVVKKYYPALIDSTSKTASVQVRMRGTLAGNICTASPAGDNLAPLLAYDAVLRVQGPEGIKEIPAAEFFTGVKKTVLKHGELLTHIILPAPSKNTGSAYTKLTRRKAMDIGVLGSAVRVVCDDKGICTAARIALLAASPTPVRAYEAEKYLIGKKLTEEAMNKAGELAFEIAKPKTWRSNEEYSRDMVKVIVPQTIADACIRMKKGGN